MAESQVAKDELAVGAGGFTAAQVQALRNVFEDLEDRMAAVETVAASFGDLSTADVNDTLVADANGVFQVNPVA